MVKLPPLTQQPILHVNATPDADYPLRILRAHRHNADCNWEYHGDRPEPEIIRAMRELNAQRAEILDAAIGVLERNSVYLRRAAKETEKRP